VPDIEYFQRHSQFSSESGINNFETRRVSVELRSESELETELQEIDPREDPAVVESAAEGRPAP